MIAGWVGDHSPHTFEPENIVMKLHYLMLWLMSALLLVSCSGTSDTSTNTPGPEQTGLAGDVARGQEIFRIGLSDSPPCLACHRTDEGGFAFSLGPNLMGIAERATTRIAGVTARQYLEASIMDPDSFVVPGYRDIMYPDFAEHFSAQDLADLVAYLLTL
jgi:mono/diheme cytochrome c family protein